MSKISVCSIELLSEFENTLGVCVPEAVEIMETANRKIRLVHEHLDSVYRYWSQELSRRERDLRNARNELAHCHNSGYYDDDGYYVEPDCSYYENWVDSAWQQVEEARQECSRLKNLGRHLQSTIQSFLSDAESFKRGALNECQRARDFLKRYVSALGAVAAQLASTTDLGLEAHSELSSVVIGSGQSQTQEGSFSNASSSVQTSDPRSSGLRAMNSSTHCFSSRPEEKWQTRSFFELDVNKVDLTGSHVENKGDFKAPYTYDVIKDGLAKLTSVVAPAVEKGADADYFSRLDKRKGLKYVNGYRTIYDAYYGSSDPIKVTWDGKSWSVENGTHRIWAAQRLGITNLPVIVTMSKSDWNTFDNS